MMSFYWRVLPAVPLLIAFGAGGVHAQSRSNASKTRSSRPSAATAVVPRTPYGRPDLEGIWTNATLTPFERPTALGSKEFFTEQEAAEFLKVKLQGGVTNQFERGPVDVNGRSYRQVWLDPGSSLVETRRTSLIIDPPDGKIPPLTPEARVKFQQTRAENLRHYTDGVQDRTLFERCILFGGEGPPMLNEPINNNYQIVQSKDHIAILVEMNHTTRIIPLDQRPHVSSKARSWVGDSRGHWEGDSLVVETTNFAPNEKTRFGIAYDGMTDENLRIIERFTRIDANTIIYRATMIDPTIFTKPWTVELPMKKRSEPLYEYACHEGNYGLANILSGARAEEKAKATQAK